MYNTNEKQPSSHVAIGLAGALIGAIGASAILLSDSETRKRAMKMASDARDTFMKWKSAQMSEFEKQKGKIEETKDSIEKEIEK